MNEPVVVGVDGSESAEHAVDWAAAEALRRRRPLRIVHAVENWPYRTPLFMPSDTVDRLAHISGRVVEMAERRARRHAPELEISTVRETGETFTILTRQSEDAFELVLGNRGRGGFASLLLGSTSLRMAAWSPVPVVIVREEAVEDGDVVVGLDLGKDEKATLDFAFDAAAVRGARLRVVHAWPLYVYAPFAEPGYVSDEDAIEAELREQVTGVLAPWRTRYPQVEVVERLPRTHPVPALAEASRDAALLVAGARERGRHAPRLGPVAHGAVHHAHCPVTVVPR
ncbi:universal stress protein [Actinomadura logoneensis]|uniref:Universal stress protein n=1 Tax=Actinomadura logoneensis TaxID=2293572 RepID=A0A372JER8_9ACTN|nr:universal stress protein [Actinomadura logoneensis]RFU38389.1 universal stress protein [Actinomadura logoneensis]